MYLEERERVASTEREREMERASILCRSLIPVHLGRVGPRRSQGGLQLIPSLLHEYQGPRFLGHDLLPVRVHVSGKLDWT